MVQQLNQIHDMHSRTTFVIKAVSSLLMVVLSHAFQHNLFSLRASHHVSPTKRKHLALFRGQEVDKFRTLKLHEKIVKNSDEFNLQTRRNVLGGIGWLASFPLLPDKSFAEDDETSLAPFKVVLSVQTDPQQVDTFDIEIEVYPEWAPLGAHRFKELVESGFYKDSRFFRVLPGYVAQFGIAADPKLNKKWMFCEKNCRALPDEVRKESNKRGTLSFASSGKNSRQTQVFINLGSNDGPPNFLDAQNFVPFARVTKGMDDTVKKLNSEYGIVESVSGGLAGSVNQGKAAYYGAEYLDAVFPKLSIIRDAKVI